MKIDHLAIRNYRTLESVDIAFASSYSAICGPNDSGKTNVVRAIRALVKEESPLELFPFPEADELSIKNDFPKFSDTEAGDRFIKFAVKVSVHQYRDAGFYEFLKKQLSLKAEDEAITFHLETTFRGAGAEPAVQIAVLGKTYEGLEAQEVLKRLQSSRSILVHNSTRIESDLPFRQPIGHLRAVSQEDETLVAAMKRTVNKGLAKLSKTHKQRLETLLGRLGTKYAVSLSMPAFDFTSVPYSVTLGHAKYAVPLDDWGSGTKNRTLILLALFRAKQIGDADPSASKTTPIIIVEEPESFLHPAAQASFGCVLQDLAEEFGVQVIVTTHSPYLLNLRDPSSNILLERKMHYHQPRETVIVDTSGDNWMEPFSRALGLASEEFKPWKELILAGSDALLLVEGETDRRYFELLRDDKHGAHRLTFSGEIVSYEGTGSLSNSVLLRFIRNRHHKLFVTFDLDASSIVEKTLQGLSLIKGKDYAPVGTNAPGKRAIEGLLPDRIITEVASANPSLVQQATAGTKEEQESAKRKLKGLYLEHFKATASPGEEDYGGFYPLVKTINKALS
jgi:putative ATP-dependent endonuclease of OLD family